METEDADSATRTGRRRITALLAVVACAILFGSYQVLLIMEAEQSNSCELTPPGYERQTLVETKRHLLWYDCVLDPGNGEPRYTIHRPWQSVRNANGDDPASSP